MAMLWFGALGQGPGEMVTLHLRNGDRLTGLLLCEDTNEVVITTIWSKELSVPATEIASRETAAPLPEPVVPALLGPPLPLAVIPPSVPVKPKHWSGEVRVGAAFLYGAKDQQIFYGRSKLAYEQAYTSNPKQFFRNIVNYTMNYGKTEGVLSANDMNGSDKTDFDFGRYKFYVYNLGSAGYDEIRKIDLQYEDGPGLGYHLFTPSNFVMNVESGMNYWAQIRSDNTSTENFYFRLGEDVTWRLNKKLAFVEKLEYFPQVQSLDQYRTRFESTLSYGLWQNLSLNLTLVDLYDTQPAEGVPNNDLQIRSSLGITF